MPIPPANNEDKRAEIEKVLNRDARDPEMLTKVQEVISSMSAQERAIIDSFVLGMSQQDAARSLGISFSTFRRRFRDVLDKLRKKLKENVEVGDAIVGPTNLAVYVDPGGAPEELIAELFVTLASLYCSLGGSGLQIVKDQRRAFVGEALT